MIKASKTYWFVQISGWFAFCIMTLFAQLFLEDFHLFMLVELAFLFLTLLIASHGIRYFLVKYDWINYKLSKLVPILLFLSYSSSAISLAFIYLLTLTHKAHSIERVFEFFISTWVYFLFFLLWSTVYLSFHLIRKSRRQEIEQIKLQASHHEIELKNLKEQLNPHFLFNSLNSIRALIGLEPQNAKQAVTDLSNLMRSSLQMGKKTLVPLEQELALIKDYLALEKIRFEERLNYRIEENAPSSLLIPPFILQTLVENAIKHGIAQEINGGDIIINTHLLDKVLRLSVRNTGKLSSTNENSIGIGIENTKRRLSLQYEKNANFELKEEDGFVEATILIDLQKK